MKWAMKNDLSFFMAFFVLGTCFRDWFPGCLSGWRSSYLDGLVPDWEYLEFSTKRERGIWYWKSESWNSVPNESG